MALLRVIVDIETTRRLASRERQEVADAIRQYAHGVLPNVSTVLTDADKSEYGVAHMHDSNDSTACSACIRNAQDGRS